MRALRRAVSFAYSVAYRQRLYRALNLLGRYLDDGEPVSPRAESPLIVIGMHRSGTSLLTRQLEDLGVDMGAWQGRNTSEALFFRHRNQLLFSLTHASWDNPDAFLRALEVSEWRRAFARVVSSDLGTIRTLNFLPPKALARFVSAPKKFWGFKDPRTTVTLPVWNDVFPNARVINIVRDGNAVASSLLERSKKQLADGLPVSLISLDPTRGLSLWADYVLAAHQHCQPLSSDRYLEIRYENLVQTPEAVLRDISDFVGLESDSDRIVKAASRVYQLRRPVEVTSPVGAKAQKALELYNYL